MQPCSVAEFLDLRVAAELQLQSCLVETEARADRANRGDALRHADQTARGAVEIGKQCEGTANIRPARKEIGLVGVCGVSVAEL